MSKVVGVRLRKNGKVYDFDSGHFVLKIGDKVVVNTEQGQALGVVAVEPRLLEESEKGRVLKEVYRVANENDVEKNQKGRGLEKDVYAFCYERICKRNLPMSLVSTERLFDGSKIMVYFSADGRVDFRELVKDLVQRFHIRIEMRQIGVRHQAKMVGGLGSCGRQLCCSSFLNNFEPVSIKMAKKQNLSLNPAKISGMCGRLMCCLTYEYEYYNKAKKNIPKIGKSINTTKGAGKVTRQNLLKETLTIMLESKEEVEITPRDIIKDNGKGDQADNQSGKQNGTQSDRQSSKQNNKQDNKPGSKQGRKKGAKKSGNKQHYKKNRKQARKQSNKPDSKKDKRQSNRPSENNRKKRGSSGK